MGLHFLKIYIVLDKIGKFLPPAFFEGVVFMSQNGSLWANSPLAPTCLPGDQKPVHYIQGRTGYNETLFTFDYFTAK